MRNDVDTGLILMGARYYDSAIGRFITRDKNNYSLLIPISLNPYNYCLNSPISYIDPEGLIYITTEEIKQMAEMWHSIKITATTFGLLSLPNIPLAETYFAIAEVALYMEIYYRALIVARELCWIP